MIGRQSLSGGVAQEQTSSTTYYKLPNNIFYTTHIIKSGTLQIDVGSTLKELLTHLSIFNELLILD